MGRFLGIFYIEDFIICKQRQFYLFLSDLYALFPFLTSLNYRELPVLCWMAMIRANILALFTILGENIYSFPVKHDASWRLLQMFFIKLRKLPPFMVFWGFYEYQALEFVDFFLTQLLCSWFFFFSWLMWYITWTDFQMFK